MSLGRSPITTQDTISFVLGSFSGRNIYPQLDVSLLSACLFKTLPVLEACLNKHATFVTPCSCTRTALLSRKIDTLLSQAQLFDFDLCAVLEIATCTSFTAAQDQYVLPFGDGVGIFTFSMDATFCLYATGLALSYR